MKKKIVAAVLALLMVASSVPMAEFAEFVPDIGITASAANVKKGTVTVKGSNIDYQIKDGVLTVSPTENGLGVFYTESNGVITVDTTAIKTAIAKDADISGCKTVELNYVFNYDNDSIANVVFSSNDTFITSLKSQKGGMFSGHKNLQKVTLNNTINTIGSNTFSGCINFVGTANNVMDLSNVTTIESNAFSGCESLAGVKFSSSLKTIDSQAFKKCTKLMNVMIPKSVTTIGGSCFDGDTSLAKVTFESGSQLKELGDYAFQKCSMLSAVYVGTTKNTLPAGVTLAGKGCFSDCASIQEFKLNKTALAVSEKMFDKCTSLMSFTFESSSKCTIIGADAFNGCSSLNSIELPDTVLGIGAQAFINCNKLSKAIVSDNLTAIGAKAFAGCWVLSLAPTSKKSSVKSNQIIMPDKVSVIPANCFEKCSNITSVLMSKVTQIEKEAFLNCTSLPKVTIPDAVTTINESVFEGCIVLQEVTYSKKLEEIQKSAFEGCTALYTVTPNGTTAINGAVQFPSTCKTVRESAFQDCTSFKYMNMLLDSNSKSSFATIEHDAFSGCTSLEGSTTNGTTSEELKFPSGLSVIQKNVFYNCASLKAVKFAGNVSSIGDYAFQKCTNLTKVTMNDTISQIGLSAFENCSSLAQLPVTPAGKCALTQLENIKASTFKGCTSLKVADISTATKISSIDSSAFTGCTALTKLILPANGAIKSIGNSAFDGCTSLAVVATSASATKSTFPTSVATIGNKAFNKTALAYVTVPKTTNGYNQIGESAFANCEKLTNVDLSATNLTTLSDGIFSYDAALKSVKLPATLTTIEDEAFLNCEQLSTINSTTKGEAKLPANLKTIGNKAFQNNHCVSRMVIPAATDNIHLSAWNFNLTYKQEDLDSGKYNPLKEFVVDSKNANYKSVNGVLFNKSGTELLLYPLMKADKTYTVPSTVKSITESAFSSNNIIQKVIIPTSTTTIAKNAFNKCESLTAVEFGNNKTVKFDDKAFTIASGSPIIAFYAAKGSTAETYANANSKSIKFVDNSKMATKLTIKEGTLMYSSKGSKFQLTPVLTTKSGEQTTDVLTWTSSVNSVATVDSSGNVSAKSFGKTTITVSTANGLKASIVIDVGNASERLSGSNRWSTATVISERAFDKSNTVILAYGKNYADALAGVPLAAKLDAPILLTNTKAVPDATIEEIKRLGAKNVIILGGTGAIDASVETTLKNKIKGLTIERIAGAKRYETATKIAQKMQTLNGDKAPEEVFFVYAKNYADALSISPVAAKKNAPIIYLNTKGDLDKATEDYLKGIKGKVKKAYVIGGDSVISDDMMKKAGNALGVTPTRISGKNKYVTCVKVNQTFASTLAGKTICISTGQDFPDALVGGVLAAKNSAPLFLVNGTAKTLNDEQKTYLKGKAATKFFVLGGESAVPATKVNEIMKVK